MFALLARLKPNTTTESDSTTELPKKVIARYLTLGHSTVDLTHEQEAEQGWTRSTCNGCKDTAPHSWANWYQGTREVVRYQDQSKGDREARLWAQTHAEKCRALTVSP